MAEICFNVRQNYPKVLLCLRRIVFTPANFCVFPGPVPLSGGYCANNPVERGLLGYHNRRKILEFAVGHDLRHLVVEMVPWASSVKVSCGPARRSVRLFTTIFVNMFMSWARRFTATTSEREIWPFFATSAVQKVYIPARHSLRADTMLTMIAGSMKGAPGGASKDPLSVLAGGQAIGHSVPRIAPKNLLPAAVGMGLRRGRRFSFHLLGVRILDVWADRMQTLMTSFARSPSLNVARVGAKPGFACPLALKVIAVSILLPDEIGLSISGLRFSVARIILLVLTPFLLMRFVRMLAAGRYRFVLSDLLVPLTGSWVIVALANMDGLQAGLNHAGPIALEFCIGYMAARFLLSEHGEAVSFINFLCWAIAIVALLGLLDPLTHRYLLHDLAGTLFGDATGVLGDKIVEGGDERLGLLRATSAIEHPILFGITCAVGLLLAASVKIRGRRLVMFACTLGTLLALSAAPVQAALLGFALLIYNRILGGIRYRWAGLIALATVGIIVVFNIFNDPLGFIFSHFVFDTGSAWFRRWEWTMASAAVSQSPWFGVGWVIPESYGIPWTIDSIWLLWELTFGVPGSVLLALSLIGAASLLTNGSRVRLTAAESKLGTTLGILIFLIIFLGFTVDFFGSAWILIPVLAGIRAHLGELGRISGKCSALYDEQNGRRLNFAPRGAVVLADSI
jgi:hypothetical protein